MVSAKKKNKYEGDFEFVDEVRIPSQLIIYANISAHYPIIGQRTVDASRID